MSQHAVVFVYFCLVGSVFSGALITPKEVLEGLPDTPYGFSFIDMGITPEQLQDFNQLDVQKRNAYNEFGPLVQLEENVLKELRGVGMNDEARVARLAALIADISKKVLTASSMPVAWFSLRVFLPTPAYDVAHWHMDGYYFRPTTLESMMYKFSMTLIGPSTLFYPVPQDQRREVWKLTADRPFMHEFCKKDLIIRPKQGEGVFFMSGRNDRSALHSEPKIDTCRLFFSLVPCTEPQLAELKPKVRPLWV